MGWFKCFGSVEVKPEVEKVEEKPEPKDKGNELSWDREAECWRDRQEGEWADPFEYLARDLKNKELLSCSTHVYDWSTVGCSRAAVLFTANFKHEEILAIYGQVLVDLADVISAADCELSLRKANVRKLAGEFAKSC